MNQKIRVTIWNEFRHEKKQDAVRKIYPNGMHRVIADGLLADDLEIRLAALDDPEHGLPEEVVNNTDVLLWWGHCSHHEVKDEIVARVHKRVLEGMGLIVLHSGHFSKIFRAVTDCTCALKWRETAEKERLWNIEPSHPIARGIGESIVVPNSEMYGERFDIPQDGKIIFISWYEGGNVFRSGVAFERGFGKIFYFSPGHETYPIYYQPEIIQVIGNAVRWANPSYYGEHHAPMAPALEPISSKETEFGRAGIVQKADGSNAEKTK